MIRIYLVLTIWIIIAIGFGIVEGFIFDTNLSKTDQFKEKWSFDIHFLFTAIRMFPAVILVYILYSIFGWQEALNGGLFMIFCFPFFHDGAYYQTRKILSKGAIYKNGWFDRSKTTTAILSFGFYLRALLLILGVMLFLPW